MPYNLFQTETVADVSKIMENFYYLWDGNRLPYSISAASTLTAQNNAYDLGSSTYRWNEIYANKVYASSVTADNMFYRLATIEVTAAVTYIEFTGLNSDLYNNLLINVLNQASNVLYMYCNNDSATSKYNSRFYHYTGTAFQFYNYSTSGVAYFDIQNMYSKNTIALFNCKNRNLISNTFPYQGVGSYHRLNNMFISNSNTGTLTSLKFALPSGGTITAGTKITIWAN